MWTVHWLGIGEALCLNSRLETLSLKLNSSHHHNPRAYFLDKALRNVGGFRHHHRRHRRHRDPQCGGNLDSIAKAIRRNRTLKRLDLSLNHLEGVNFPLAFRKRQKKWPGSLSLVMEHVSFDVRNDAHYDDLESSEYVTFSRHQGYIYYDDYDNH